VVGRRWGPWGVVAALVVGLVAVAGVVGVVGVHLLSGRDESAPDSPPPTAGPDFHTRAFSPDSWWNTPLPADAPEDPDARAILDYLRTGPESGPGCLTLAGAGDSPWGQPIFTSRRSDPEYSVEVEAPVTLPELENVRMPRGARPAGTNDAAMTLYDPRRGYVVMFTGLRYDEDEDSWSAEGATVTYLDSNGLHVDTGLSDDPRNQGSHRGNNGATAAVPWDEVREGEIRHVLKMAAGPEVSEDWVFPMVGSDGDSTSTDPGVPPQGLRLRIKPSVDLDELDLDPQALIIARALQVYGTYIGDSGGRNALKLENTVVQGEGQKWKVDAEALCQLPFSPEYWDVIEAGYDPTGMSIAGQPR
jgi:hypothetical protein